MPLVKFNNNSRILSVQNRNIKGGSLFSVKSRLSSMAQKPLGLAQKEVNAMPKRMSGLSVESKMNRELKEANQVLGGTIMERIQKDPLEQIRVPKFDAKGKKMNRNNIRITL